MIAKAVARTMKGVQPVRAASALTAAVVAASTSTGTLAPCDVVPAPGRPGKSISPGAPASAERQYSTSASRGQAA